MAKQARVSIATVSRVINGTKFVSEDARERVLAAMEQLKYQPNALGQNLRRQQTQAIGVLIPNVGDPFFGALAFAIEKALFEQGFRAQICSTENNPDKETAYVDMLIRQQVDAVIFNPSIESDENVRRLVNNDMPVVVIERPLRNVKVTEVLIANDEGGYTAIEHLAELGHRRIAVIGSYMGFSPGTERLQGARRALEDYGVFNPEYLIGRDLGPFELGFAAATELLQRPDRPTAIFAMTDIVAVGVMNAAYRLKIEIPDQLSVIGFDNLPLASYSRPGLTTIAQPIHQLGATAVDLLLRYLHKVEAPIRRVILDTELVIRDSTAPPPQMS